MFLLPLILASVLNQVVCSSSTCFHPEPSCVSTRSESSLLCVGGQRFQSTNKHWESQFGTQLFIGMIANISKIKLFKTIFIGAKILHMQPKLLDFEMKILLGMFARPHTAERFKNSKQCLKTQEKYIEKTYCVLSCCISGKISDIPLHCTPAKLYTALVLNFRQPGVSQLTLEL